MASDPDPQTADLRASIQKEVTQQATKLLVLTALSAIGVAATGWWFYLQPKLVGLTGGVPSNAVVPFDTAGDCPDGWDDFPEGNSRTVIGAGDAPGLTTRRYREVGGVEKHRLTVPEMPEHSHPGNVGTGGASFEHHQSNSRMPSERWQARTGTTGAGKAHENMPPYIALKFCKKR